MERTRGLVEPQFEIEYGVRSRDRIVGEIDGEGLED